MTPDSALSMQGGVRHLPHVFGQFCARTALNRASSQYCKIVGPHGCPEIPDSFASAQTTWATVGETVVGETVGESVGNAVPVWPASDVGDVDEVGTIVGTVPDGELVGILDVGEWLGMLVVG